MTNTDKPQNIVSTDALQGDIVDTILIKMGGIRPMAQKLGISVSTVQGWKQRRMIPKNRMDSIDSYFKQNFSMSVYDLPVHTIDNMEDKDTTPVSPNTTPEKLNTPISAVRVPNTKIHTHTKDTAPAHTQHAQGHTEKTNTTSNQVKKNAPKPTATPHTPIHKQKSWLKICVAMFTISILTTVGLVVSAPYWYRYIDINGKNSQPQPIQQGVLLTYADMKPFLQPLQQDIADLNNTVASYTSKNQSDISNIQNNIQDIHNTFTNIKDFYAEVQTMTENMQTDIAHIQKLADIRTIYALQWHILYGVIMGGESYTDLLATLTIPQSDTTKNAWHILHENQQGIITHTQIRQFFDKNAFLIAPALVEQHITGDSPMLDRIKAKITHLVFVVRTPSAQGVSENTVLNTLYTALDTNNTAYILDTLNTLNTPEISPFIHRINNRYKVLQALQTIWENLPHNTLETHINEGNAR